MQGCKVEGGETLLVDKFTSMYKITRDVGTGRLSLKGCRYLVILLGRAEMLNRVRSLLDGMTLSVAAVRKCSPTCYIIFSGPLPRGKADPVRVKRLITTEGLVRARCSSEHKVVFVNIWNVLVKDGAVDPLAFNGDMLSDAGKTVLNELLQAKLNELD